jgi:hypothetical protein
VRPIRFSKKEKGIAVAAACLGLASLRPADPYVVYPMLCISCVAFLYLAYHHEGRRSWRICFAVVVTAILGFVGYRQLPTLDVIVEPEHVTFDPSVHQANYIFSIRNKRDGYIYAAEMKLKMYGAAFDDFAFDIPPNSRKPVLEGSGVADIQIAGCIDRQGNGVALVWAYRIDPKSFREITATHTIDSKAVVDARIVSYSIDPVPRIGDVTKASASFKIDEPLKCDHALMLWLGWSPGLRQTVKTLLTVRCKFIVADPGTDLGWACR